MQRNPFNLEIRLVVNRLTWLWTKPLSARESARKADINLIKNTRRKQLIVHEHQKRQNFGVLNKVFTAITVGIVFYRTIQKPRGFRWGYKNHVEHRGNKKSRFLYAPLDQKSATQWIN